MITEEQKEYNLMYNSVLQEVKDTYMRHDEIIEYLVVKCYYISAHNDILQEKFKAIKKLINPFDEKINDDLFPF